MNVLEPGEVPQNIDIEWGCADNTPVVEAIHYKEGGTFTVHHGQLAPNAETAVVLRAAGVRMDAIEDILGTQVGRLTEAACRTYGLPKIKNEHYPRMTMLVGRLCLPKSILEVTSTIHVPVPDELYIKIMTALGEGKDWKDIQRVHGFGVAVARRIIREYDKIDGQILNFNPFLLRQYGAKNIDPETVVANQQPFAKPPQLPLVYKAPPKPKQKVQKLTPAPETLDNAAPERIKDIPALFRPFKEDADKKIHLTKNLENEYDVSHIEFESAMLEVIDTDTITNWNGETISLNANEKLALTLIAMGANQQELIKYCMEDRHLSNFRKKLGIPTQEYGLTQATILACRELLSPINPTRWVEEQVPDFSLVDQYVSLLKTGRGLRYSASNIRARFSNFSAHYTKQNKSPTCKLNMMILLAYADDRLPENVLK